jgi:WD40 repeat protein
MAECVQRDQSTAELRLWQPDTGDTRVLPTPNGEVCSPMAFSPDGKTLAVALGRWVRIWDLVAGQPVGVPFGQEGGRITDLAYARDGKTLAIARQYGELELWQAGTWRRMLSLNQVPGGSIRELAFSPDGHTLAAACIEAGERGLVAVWRARPR